MISHTPLVGAPSRICEAISSVGIECDLFTLNDYPNHLKELYAVGRKISSIDEIPSDAYSHIWVHNQLSEYQFDLLFAKFKTQKKIIHLHSGIHEGPLNERTFSGWFQKFDVMFVVAQAWARLYPEALLIPNIVPVNERPRSKSVRIGERIEGLYSPSHGKGGRFGFKDSKATARILEEAVHHNDLFDQELDIEIVNYPLKQTELFLKRSNYDFNIDEVFTGGFHQVSLEALSAGSVAINDSDIFSDLAFTHAVNASELPPFVRVSDFGGLASLLANELRDIHFVGDYGSMSLEYFQKYLHPQRLASLVLEKIESYL
jgi:hypothetical protein